MNHISEATEPFTASPVEVPPDEAKGMHRLLCWACEVRAQHDNIRPEHSVTYDRAGYFVTVTLIGERDAHGLNAYGAAEHASCDEAARLAIGDLLETLRKRAEGASS